ncbi:MAG: flagellar hook-length control protein FliK [Burkholderiaceae bacterium]
MAVPRTDSTGVRPLAAVAAITAITPLGDLRQEALDRLVRLEVGKQFQAQIVSRLDDGTFVVRIADTSARIALPGGVKVGDSLALTLVTRDPRPTFTLDSLNASEAGSAGLPPGSRVAQALYLSTAIGAEGLPAGTDGMYGAAAPAHLSEAGRLITDLLNRTQETGTTVRGTSPLTPAAGAAAPQLALALQDTLAFSGVFYESHVAQWVNGERPLADLLREPQARHGAVAAGAGAANPAAMLSELPAQLLETRRALREYFSSALLPGTAGHSVTGIDAGSAQMISLQLNSLEQQKVHWQGELWPGQPIQWEVRRDDQPAQTADIQPDKQSWQSVVRFTLPSLGVISATINLTNNRVQVQVRTASEESAGALRRHGISLASALDAAGSALDKLTVTREAALDARS